MTDNQLAVLRALDRAPGTTAAQVAINCRRFKVGSKPDTHWAYRILEHYRDSGYVTRLEPPPEEPSMKRYCLTSMGQAYVKSWEGRPTPTIEEATEAQLLAAARRHLEPITGRMTDRLVRYMHAVGDWQHPETVLAEMDAADWEAIWRDSRPDYRII